MIDTASGMYDARRKLPIQDGEEVLMRADELSSNHQDWLVSWHDATSPPEGTPHGASGLCVTATGEIVITSADAVLWDLPGGRPEGEETWEQTLRREVLEEACATVKEARLLDSAAAPVSRDRSRVKSSFAQSGMRRLILHPGNRTLRCTTGAWSGQKPW